jgi:hypothetical protein
MEPRRLRAFALRAAAAGAVSAGAFAIGALAVGALAIGSLAVSRLALRTGRFKDVYIERLTVGELRIEHFSREGEPQR